MKSKIFTKIVATSTLTLAVAGSAFASIALAQESETNTPTINNTREPLRPQVKPTNPPVKSEVRQEVKNIQTEKREDVKNLRVEASKNIKEERDEMRTTVKNAREDGVVTPEERGVIKTEAINTQKEVRGIKTELRQDVAERKEAAVGDIKKVIESRKTNIASTSSAIQEERKQRAIERAGAYAAKMLERISSAIDRIEKLQDRVQSRIDKVKTAGGNVTTSQTKLDESKAKLSEAKNLLPTISAGFAEATTPEKVSDGIRKVQESTKAVNEKIKESHAALIDSINSLKGLKGASTTPTVVINDNASSDAE